MNDQPLQHQAEHLVPANPPRRFLTWLTILFFVAALSVGNYAFSRLPQQRLPPPPRMICTGGPVKARTRNRPEIKREITKKSFRSTSQRSLGMDIDASQGLTPRNSRPEGG